MNPYDAADELDALDASDPEYAHGRADEILLSVVRVFAPQVADAYERADERIHFWYA